MELTNEFKIMIMNVRKEGRMGKMGKNTEFQS